MNVKDKRVELRSSKFTESTDALQMGADFISAFAMGFDIDDAIALLRLDSLYIQSFDIKDVRQTLGVYRTFLCLASPRLTRDRTGCAGPRNWTYCWKGRGMSSRDALGRSAADVVCIRKPSLPLRMVRCRKMMQGEGRN